MGILVVLFTAQAGSTMLDFSVASCWIMSRQKNNSEI